MNAAQLSPSEYLPFYSNYVKTAGLVDLISGLEVGLKNTSAFFESIPEEKLEYQYADSKWTVKEIIQHLIDAERVFTYRALRFARQDATPLQGFEESSYATASFANIRSRESLIEEYGASRQSTLHMFKSFSDAMLMKVGVASGGEMSVRAIGFVIIGHEAHHCNIIKERYL